MRLFRYVFGGLLVAIGVGAAGWVVREKLVLAIAGYRLRNEVASVKRMAYKGKMGSCKAAVEGYQLRFVSATEYVTEPICPGENGDVGQQYKLFGGVRRLYGSGIMIPLIEGMPDLRDAWVHLVYGNSQVVVGLFDGLPKVKWDTDNYGIGGDSPAKASCPEWGFACCVSGEEVGELAQVRTYDCANNCYQRCNRLPLVLYFNTDPVMNQKTREVVVQKMAPVVQFGYTISDDQEGVKAEIDFGDGKKSGQLPSQKTDVQHEYQCKAESCVYQVNLSGHDQTGHSLVVSERNSLKVVVH